MFKALWKFFSRARPSSEQQLDSRQPPVSRTIEVVPVAVSEEQSAQIANVLQAPAPRSLPQVMDMLASADATASRLLDKRR